MGLSVDSYADTRLWAEVGGTISFVTSRSSLVSS